jgi:phosphatidylserine/phosphatidylglycerophosphate/cardiolipin synthase-like enzyme
MINFSLSNQVMRQVLNELELAQNYIRIAVFQLHSNELFQLLLRKRNEGLRIEILTLPYDSINPDIREVVTERLQNIINQGAIVHFCKWNVGDPGRTSTAVGKWYAFHGKFIVTDKSAIALSANFTEGAELDAALIYRDELEKIAEFNSRFDELLVLLITEHHGYNGTLREQVENSGVADPTTLFILPQVIETATHQNHWITQYPAIMCPTSINVEDKLYFAPFNIRARSLYISIINEAEEFIYLSAESFTDPDISEYLIKKKLTGVDIKVISGSKSMDFKDRIQEMFRELLAYNIEVKTLERDLHAKLLITDKRLLVGSINLNKMNLGFPITSRYWRGNTETATICSNQTIIQTAKDQFEELFLMSINIENKLADNIIGNVGKLFKSVLDTSTKKDVKQLFAKFVLSAEIDVKKATFKLAKLSKKLVEHFHRKVIKRDDFIMAVILYHLSDRKIDLTLLIEKIHKLDNTIDVQPLVNQLIEEDFIELEDNYYKLNINALF